jgi:tetratricopeptide (TPR) repeat protein/GGDEF domain-containing protein
VIHSPAPADDFARQLALDELGSFLSELAVERPAMVCSALPDGFAALRADLGDARIEALLRELALFIRRNLRGSDAIAASGEELVLVLDVPAELTAAVLARLLAAVRGHVFSGGAADRSLRLTLALGVVSAGGREATLERLLPKARAARAAVERDGVSIAAAGRPHALDLPRFVGRSDQLATLSGYLDDAARSIGRVVAIIGEPGIGASSLSRALEPEIRVRGGSLVSGSCQPHPLSAPYTLWTAMLRAVRRLPVKSTRIWRELPALERNIESGAERRNPGGSKTQLLEELADFFRLAAQQRPLVMLLDDVQWADSASLDALEYLASQFESERVLILVTIQTGVGNGDVIERWEQLVGRPRHHELRLSHLTRDDVKQWLEGAMRTEEPGRDLLAHLYRHTEGNPFLLTHLLRDLEESGHIVRRQGEWRWTPIASLPGVTSIDSLLSRRIARLPRNTRSLFDAAAVLEREADETLLLEICGGDPVSVHASLQVLLDAGLFVSSYDRERATYVLAHDEIARVGRQILDRDELGRLHNHVAEALERRGGASVEIAGHFEQAGNLIEAHRFALRGADDALRVHETGAVAEFLAVAERTAPDAAAQATVRVRMASLADLSGRFEEAEQYCDAALAWYESQQAPILVLQLKRTRARVRMLRGHSATDTLHALLALEQEALAVNAEAERAAILLLISQIRWRLGEGRAAQRMAAECMAIAERVGDDELLSDACNRLGVIIQIDDPIRARELYIRSLEISTAMGDTFRRTRALGNIGVIEVLNNNWDEARRVLTTAADQARTAGLTEAWGRAELNLGVLAARVGDYDGAARALSEALRLAAAVQDTTSQLISTYNIAHLERELERYSEAINTYGLVYELSARIGQAEIQTGALAGQGLSRLQVGDLAGARASFKLADELVEPLKDWFQGKELIEALRIHLLIVDGEIERSVRLFEEVMKVAEPADVFAAAWLTAEFLAPLRFAATTLIEEAARRYGGRPEVLANEKLSLRLNVSKLNS